MSEWYIQPAKLLFPKILWNGPRPHVYLTFDDGPHPVATPRVLDVLKRERVQASFFAIGQHAEEHPDIVRRIVDEGHSVGNHSYDHRPLWVKESSEVTSSLRRAQRAIGRAAGREPALFRPPYGRFDASTADHASSIGLRTVVWGVNAWDFSDHRVDSIVRHVGETTQPGDIVLLHDNAHTAEMIEVLVSKIIAILRRNGHSFASLPAHA